MLSITPAGYHGISLPTPAAPPCLLPPEHRSARPSSCPRRGCLPPLLPFFGAGGRAAVGEGSGREEYIDLVSAALARLELLQGCVSPAQRNMKSGTFLPG